MNGRNLIPASRLAARRRRAEVRRWSAVNGGYAAVLAVAGGLWWAAEAAPAVTPTPQPAGPPTAVAAAASPPRLAALRRAVSEARAAGRSLRDVSATPDWSLLLRAVADRLGPDVVLDGVAVAGGRGTATAVVTVDGAAASSPAVAAFVLRVERLGVFARVELVRTTAATVDGAAAVGFRIACELPGDAVAEDR